MTSGQARANYLRREMPSAQDRISRAMVRDHISRLAH